MHLEVTVSQSAQTAFTVFLPDSEGTLSVLVHQLADITPEVIDKQHLSQATLTHNHVWGDGTRIFRAFKVSPDKVCLVCEGCGLRLSLPKDAVTVGAIRNHFTTPVT